jgi:hypothetical protein
MSTDITTGCSGCFQLEIRKLKLEPFAIFVELMLNYFFRMSNPRKKKKIQALRCIATGMRLYLHDKF